MKIVISPYLDEKSSDFDEILYTAADFELDERHVIKNEKVALDRLRARLNVFLVKNNFCSLDAYSFITSTKLAKTDAESPLKHEGIRRYGPDIHCCRDMQPSDRGCISRHLLWGGG